MSKNEDDNVVFVKDPSSRLSSSPKHIYEVFLEYVSTGNKDKPVEPKVLQTFPKDYNWDEDTKKNFPKFCFPCRPFTLEKQQCFTFTLTDIDGNYRFGFCYFPKESNCTKCYCFFSYLPWFEFFYWALERINEFKKDLSEVHKVEPFLSALYDHSVPEVMNNMDQQAPVISILPQGNLSHSYKFPLPHPHKTPSLPTDHNLHLMYTNLSHEVIIAIFASAIYERRIIMHSKDLSLLSACIHATDALLYPLHWQHIFCPIMPPSLMDYCCAPMPFLMGVHESIMKDVERMPIDDVVIVDLDENQLESPYLSMDLEGFPASLLHGLEKVLKKASNTQGDAVAKVFMDALVAIIGGYQSALKLRPGEKEITFDRDLFIKSRTNMSQLLENLLHFQHFQQFINGRIQRKKGAFGMNRDRFDEAVSLWEDNPPKSTKIEAESLKEGIISAVKLTKKGLSKGGGLLQKKGEQVFNRIQDRMKQDAYKSDHQNLHKRSLERSSTTQVPTARQFENDMFRDPETVRQLVQLKQAHMNKAPPPVPKSYQKHKLERASLVELDIERSMEIPKSVSNNSLPNICVSTTTSNEPPTADLLSFSPPPTPPPRRRKQRGAKEIPKENAPLDVPDRGGTTLDDQSSSDEVDTSSSSSSSTTTSPIDNMVPPPLPPRDEINYVDMLQPKITTSYVDLPLTTVPPPLPPRDELIDLPPRDGLTDSPILMYNSSSAPPLPPRDEPSAPLLPPMSDVTGPTAPPRDKKRLSPNTSRKITSYTPPLQHKDIDLGPRRNSVDALSKPKSSDVSLLELENEWKSEDFGSTLARQLLLSSRSSFTEDIAKRLQSYSIMRPSKAVMDTLSNDDPFSSSLPPPLIPSTSSSPQVDRKTDNCSSTTGSNNPLDQLFDKSDLTKWVTTSSSNQQQQEKNTTTANGNVLT